MKNEKDFLYHQKTSIDAADKERDENIYGLLCVGHFKYISLCKLAFTSI